eukprot:TRINITY_DN66506_c0_g1_i1.p1 TRINITY_DN66506_c0_g1~~TRINITY_DN66506_c0_g1_i1.p1  ORF type:complete len:134 (+),score=25.57 TRINITY_DN66506_c0_g1_i1:121-522(+)
MFPYVIMLALWIAVAIVLPLLQTLHSLQTKSADRQMWLFYWALYCAASWVMYYFEWVIAIPFYVLSFYVDFYYEAQFLVVLYLVYPKTLGIKALQAQVLSNANKIDSFGKEHFLGLAKVLYGKVLELNKPKGK